MLTVDIRYLDYDPNEPRDPGGKWTSGAGGVKHKVGGFVKRGINTVTSFGEEDHHILHNAFHKPASEPRRRLAHHVMALGKALPHLMKSHFAEEKQNAIHAAGALKAMAMGLPATPQQYKGLRALGTRAVLTAGAMALSGDPTGTVHHLAGKLAEELVNHVVGEHALQAGAGALKFALPWKKKQPVPQQHDAAMGELSPEDFQRLQAFFEKLAKAAHSYDIPEDKIRQIFNGQ
jgi:hypothetical protein